MEFKIAMWATGAAGVGKEYNMTEVANLEGRNLSLGWEIQGRSTLYMKKKLMYPRSPFTVYLLQLTNHDCLGNTCPWPTSALLARDQLLPVLICVCSTRLWLHLRPMQHVNSIIRVYLIQPM